MAKSKQVNLRVPVEIVSIYQDMADNADDRDRSYFMQKALKAGANGYKPKSKKTVVKKAPEENPDDIRFCEWMYEKVKTVIPKAPEPNYTTWAKSVRLMREVDGHTHREIAEVFDWANKDVFWSVNIRSPSKLREKFPTLHAKMNALITPPIAQGRPQSGTRGMTLEQELSKEWANGETT